MFTVRRMRPDDKPALIDIASRIWDGTDYIPLVFDEWVADLAGEFAAVVLDGRVVGCAKLTFFTDTDAWLEGLRKDPRVREKGLARAVTRHLLAGLAARSGLTSVRFSTYMENRASISVNEELGFRRRVTLSRKAWDGARQCTLANTARPWGARPGTEAQAARPSRGLPRGDVRVVRDEAVVREFLERTGYLEASGGLVVDGWRALPFDRELFASRFVRAGLCRGVPRGSRLAGLSISRIEAAAGVTRATVACLDAEDDGTADALFGDIVLRLRAGLEPAAGPRAPVGRIAPASSEREAASSASEMEWMVPDLPRLLRWCAAWGLVSEIQEHDFFVYDLPLDRLPGFAT